MRKKVVLKVHRFRQHSNGTCAVAACSALANFYDNITKYKEVCKLVDIETINKEGMTTPEEGLLLNQLGLKKITIITADSYYFDFSWTNRSNKWKIERLKKVRARHRKESNHELADTANLYIKFLQNMECENNVVIDWDFSKWIKTVIRKGHPLIASINYTSYYKIKKEHNEDPDDIKGDPVEHALVIRGFDDHYIYVVDSLGKVTQIYNGYYKIKWEHFLSNFGTGDLLFAE